MTSNISNVAPDVLNYLIIPYLETKEKVRLANCDRYTYDKVDKNLKKILNVGMKDIKNIVCFDCGYVDEYSRRYNYCQVCILTRQCDECKRIHYDKNLSKVYCPYDSRYISYMCTTKPFQGLQHINQISDYIGCSYECSECGVYNNDFLRNPMYKTLVNTDLISTDNHQTRVWTSEGYKFVTYEDYIYTCEDCCNKKEFVDEEEFIQI